MGCCACPKTGTIKPGAKVSREGVIFRNSWQLSCLKYLLCGLFSNEPLRAVLEQHVKWGWSEEDKE